MRTAKVTNLLNYFFISGDEWTPTSWTRDEHMLLKLSIKVTRDDIKY